MGVGKGKHARGHMLAQLGVASCDETGCLGIGHARLAFADVGLAQLGLAFGACRKARFHGLLGLV